MGGEVIALCQICEEVKCDDYVHCKNTSCHILFICCEKCQKKLKGYCGLICNICEKFPQKLNQFLVGPDKQKHQNQFKKHYKRFKEYNYD